MAPSILTLKILKKVLLSTFGLLFLFGHVNAQSGMLVVQNAGESDANTIYRVNGGTTYYTLFDCDEEPVNDSWLIRKTGTTWEIVNPSGDVMYSTALDSEFPPLSGWSVASGSAPAPTLSGQVTLRIPTQIVLSSPGNGDSDIPLQPQLSWDSDPLATTYDVQLSTQTGFTSILLDQSGLSTSSYTLDSDLSRNETYYWRVRGVGTEGTGEWSEPISFTTIPEVPLQVTGLSPANESTDIPIQPELGWSSTTGAVTYNLVLSENSNLSDPVIEETGINGTTFQIPDNLNHSTVYFWRVRAVNAGGDGVWSQTFQFTTIIGPPGQITLTTPANHATDISLLPEFTWESIGGADTYNLQVSDVIEFTDPVVNSEGMNQTSFQLSDPLNRNVNYFWRVQGVGIGGTGVWSDPFQFTTIPEIPGAIILTLPSNESDHISVNPQFSWAELSSADSYDLIVSRESNLDDPVLEVSGIETETYTVDQALIGLTTYYWSVRGVNTGGEGSYADPFEFTTEAPDPPVKVVLTAPSNNVEDQPLRPQFSWQNALRAETYDLELYIHEYPSDPEHVITGITNNEFQPETHLTANATWYWRVRGVNIGGNGEWSDLFSFTTLETVPNVVSLVSPGNGEEKVSLTLEFSWQNEALSETYDLIISTQSNLSDPTLEVTGIESLTFTPEDPLAESTIYYWSVRGANTLGIGEYDEIFQFTTLQLPPGQVTLSNPANNNSNVSVRPNFTWSPLNDADTYNLVVSLNSNLSSPVITANEISSAQYTPENSFQFETTYYWAIQAVNDGGDGDYSNTFQFTTRADIPGMVTLLNPAINSSNVSTTPEFTWEPLDDALSYNLVISLNSDLSVPVLTANEITSAQYTSGQTLQPGTTFYWAVQSVNAVGNGPFSDPFHFSTLPDVPGQVSLVSPANTTTNVELQPILTWQNREDSNSYILELSASPDLSNPIVQQSNITTSIFQISQNLNRGSTYFWRVRGVNDGGNGEWSQIFNFITIPNPPSQVVLLNPTDGAENVSSVPGFSWSTADRAESYELTLSQNIGFTSSTINFTGISATSYSLTTELERNATWYWRVRAVNAGGFW